jgi:transposase
MRHELNDHEWSAIKPMLPNKLPWGLPRGVILGDDAAFWFAKAT